jgi:hypothetical protein
MWGTSSPGGGLPDPLVKISAQLGGNSAAGLGADQSSGEVPIRNAPPGGMPQCEPRAFDPVAAVPPPIFDQLGSISCAWHTACISLVMLVPEEWGCLKAGMWIPPGGLGGPCERRMRCQDF